MMTGHLHQAVKYRLASYYIGLTFWATLEIEMVINSILQMRTLKLKAEKSIVQDPIFIQINMNLYNLKFLN